MLTELLGNTLALYLDAAPWLLLGLVAAGLIKAWVPESVMQRWLGGSGLWPVTKAALVGAPLPLCSCGVLPAAIGLRRAGASRGSTVSFLIATPETGVDSVAVTYALMGPFMTIVRPVAAVFSAIATGLLAGMVPAQSAGEKVARQSCGCGCSCSGSAPAAAPSPSPMQKSLAGLRYAATDILDDIAPWLAVGLLLGGALLTFAPPQGLAEWGSGPLAMAAMLLMGVPMYVCATAATPLAAALLVAGISPGTVLVFLLAGPATNIATIALVRREMGNGVTVAYVAGITVTSIGLGLLTDAAAGAFGIDIQAQLAAGAEVVPAAVAWTAGALLLVAALPSFSRQALNAFRAAARLSHTPRGL